MSSQPDQQIERQLRWLVAATALACVVFGLVVDGPAAAVRGIPDILFARDILLTDYVGVGGLGAAFLQAGLVALAALAVFVRAKAPLSGPAVACLFLVLGFSLFGKNLLNVWPGIVGVWLYARFAREPFGRHVATAFFGAALAPITSEIVLSSELPLVVGIPLGLVIGVAIGFVLPPVASRLFAAHRGFSLYNMGFVAGVVATIVVAIVRSYDLVPVPVTVWTSGNNRIIGGFLAVLFLGFAGFAFALDRDVWRGLLALTKLDGRAPCDFVAEAGAAAVALNMAVTGTIALGYVLLIGGDLNGPVVGAILSVVGFAACGKHARNIVPIIVGVALGAIAKPWGFNDPAVILAALFGTALAPIAGKFGWHWGVVAGFIHSSLAQSIGVLTAGLNLYNNGFAAGLVAATLVPVIEAVRRRTRPPTASTPAPSRVPLHEPGQ